jgi:cytosine permease
MLPDYISKAVPNPASNRAPWYKNTAPTYAGIFLWVAFYHDLAIKNLDAAGVGLCMLALVAAGLLSYALFYYVPGMLGMKTGFPLYVVGSSTFGTKGGYLMPGLLMGLLQVGWFAVATFFATKYILAGFGSDAQPGSLVFALVAIAWGYIMATVGVLGIQYVSKVATFLNFIPFFMLLIVFYKTKDGLASYTPTVSAPYVGFMALVAAVIGFFATAGAAGADFGMNSRSAKDVKLGGLVGITLAVVYAAGLPMLSVAGAHGLNPALKDYGYSAVIGGIGGLLAAAMFLLFALASIPASCVCAFIAGNSFSTMLPKVPRVGSTMVGVTVSIVLAITGVAANLIGFFSIVGASFGPICGAMAADYLLAGKKWAGPREGINFAGYGAWAVGFLIGIVPFLPVSEDIKNYAQPAVVYSFIAGFVVYAILAKAGLEPKPVAMTKSAAA